MARILIGWELGAGRGHTQSMREIAQALVRQGHAVAIAVQRLDAAIDLPAGLPLFQSPLWPRLVVSQDRQALRPGVTLIDILARVGMDRPGVLTAMLRAWDAILAGYAPQLVIADHAPGLLAAAAGRLPTIAVGPGFQVPPATADAPARLGGAAPGYDEAAMLDMIDADLRDAGRPPLTALPALFRADLPLIASFPELDPYAPRPSGTRYIAPAMAGWAPPCETSGNEVFVYANGPVQRLEVLWKGLAMTGLPVRLHLPAADGALARRIARFGVQVERRPIPWPLIAARSRIAINHGAHGIMCGLMLAGIPQLALPLDLEKTLHSRAMAAAGVGTLIDPQGLTAEALAAAVRALHADTACLIRTRAAAARFAARVAIPYGEAVAQEAATLL